MKDGTFLKGRIERIVDGVMEFRAPSLGAANLLRLELAQVESFVTDESVRVSAGGVVSDGVASAAGGRVVTRGGRETNTLDQAIELWREPSQRPSETGDTRQWVTQADADLSGRRGVVAGSGFSTGFSAKGVTKADTLIGGVRFMRAEAQDRISADDLHVTLSYETNPTNVLFWYLRTDTGFDQLVLGFAEEELRQIRDNRSYWEKRLAAIARDLEEQPALIRRTFEVTTHRVEPAGALYLWPSQPGRSL